MTIDSTTESTPRKPLRLWPGVVAAALLVLARFVVPLVAPDAAVRRVARLTPWVPSLILVWWLFFSRAPWSERLGAIVLMIVALFATSRARPPVDCGRRDGDSCSTSGRSPS